MKRLMLVQLILGMCVMASAAWAADAAGDKANESIWTYVPPKWKAADDKKFSATLEVGNQQHDGTTSFQGISGAVALKYEPGIFEVVQTVNYDYLKSEDAVSKDQLKSYTGLDCYLGYRFWAFLLNDYERNLPQHMSLKMRTGAGVKYDLLRNSFWKLNFGVAALHREQRSTEGEEKGDEVLSGRLLFKLKADSVTYNFVGFYMPSLNNGSYEWSADTSLTFDLTAALALKLGFQYTFNSAPLDADVSKWEREYYTRIQLKF
jgi:hypothetical protein